MYWDIKVLNDIFQAFVRSEVSRIHLDDETSMAGVKHILGSTLTTDIHKEYPRASIHPDDIDFVVTPIDDTDMAEIIGQWSPSSTTCTIMMPGVLPDITGDFKDLFNRKTPPPYLRAPMPTQDGYEELKTELSGWNDQDRVWLYQPSDKGLNNGGSPKEEESA